MKVLFLGPPGIERRHALTAILSTANAMFPGETIFTDDWLRGIPGQTQARGIPILEDRLYDNNPHTFLSKHAYEQRREWKDAFEHFRKRKQKSSTKHFFLSMHLVYRYMRVTAIVAHLEELAKWKPDVIVTLMDDIYCVRHRLHSRRYVEFTLQDLLLWRSTELLLGDVLAKLSNPSAPPPHYSLSVRHPVKKFVRLLFSHDPSVIPTGEYGRVYISYNISDTRLTVEGRAAIDGFRRRFHRMENLFVFDPLMIDELPPVYYLKEAENKKEQLPDQLEYDAGLASWRWPPLDPELTPIVDGTDLANEYPLKIPIEEVKTARRGIISEVFSRDLRLVDQSHHIGFWRPTFPRGNVSSGVRGEIEFAKARGVNAYTYFKKGTDELPEYSPFLQTILPEYNPNAVYAETDELYWRSIDTLNALKRHDSKRDHFLL